MAGPTFSGLLAYVRHTVEHPPLPHPPPQHPRTHPLPHRSSDGWTAHAGAHLFTPPHRLGRRRGILATHLGTRPPRRALPPPPPPPPVLLVLLVLIAICLPAASAVGRLDWIVERAAAADRYLALFFPAVGTSFPGNPDGLALANGAGVYIWSPGSVLLASGFDAGGVLVWGDGLQCKVGRGGMAEEEEEEEGEQEEEEEERARLDEVRFRSQKPLLDELANRKAANSPPVGRQIIPYRCGGGGNEQ
ncbi:uncharacterized protein BKCO1_10000159 [Diplodia corticola]|uniref:Uncharacterized protein n=1 Tax=Diplodia corticola TaxID=236234 RepID=A0A1J9SAW4_9PEZI|nr:uncharacterized protein BKCO1_10000159 [Diplodia corticola]OJD36725.1 hypothetical protein BKCO1_10000159 [Diplodia corticola]